MRHHVIPAFHFSHGDSWINDPNGLIFHEGTWHLCFQTNPSGQEWGNLSWGHATSQDLLTWQEHSTAIEYEGDRLVFSGSMVNDADDTLGLGHPSLVAAYTEHFHGEPRHECQCLATSEDDGNTFTKFSENPVLDRNSDNFRDPKVFRHEGRWIMVAVEAVDNAVLFYGSDNLRDWELLSEFRNPDSAAPAWECPDLFPLKDPEGQTRWILLVSIVTGGIATGSGTQYYIGDFDGRQFTADPDAGGWLDYGRDCYAGVSFNDAPDGRRILVAWMNNWDYANQLPPGPWSRQMTLPREVALMPTDDGLALAQRPAALPGGPAGEAIQAKGPGQWEIAHPAPVLIEIGAHRIGAAVLEVNCGLVVRWENNELCVMRPPIAGLPDGFAGQVSVPVPGDELRLHMALDHNSLEIFVDNGTQVITELIPPALSGQPGVVTASEGIDPLTIVARSLARQDDSQD